MGCIPDHNRDDQLVQILKKGSPLALYNRGNVFLSFIHPDDLAAIVVSSVLGKTLRGKVVNAVNPDPVRAVDYYTEICRSLNLKPPEIVDLSSKPEGLWSVTARNNVFATIHPEVREFEFKMEIKDCILDALDSETPGYESRGEFMRKRILE